MQQPKCNIGAARLRRLLGAPDLHHRRLPTGFKEGVLRETPLRGAPGGDLELQF